MANDFENDLIEQLREIVGDKGVVLAQSQEWGVRGGKFQMEQMSDIVVDSPHEKWYTAFEAKHAKADSNTPKMYLSAKYKPEQIEKQHKYAKLSGRTFYVAVRVVNLGGADYDVIFPLQYFISVNESDEAGIAWEKLVEDGVVFNEGLEIRHLQECNRGDFEFTEQ